jgi:hypothetical protein
MTILGNLDSVASVSDPVPKASVVRRNGLRNFAGRMDRIA